MTDLLPRVIAVMNQTHDVGKTFITANLAAAISEQGISVLLIDLDPQADLSRALAVPEDEPGVDLALQGELSLEQLMLPMTDNLTLIAAGRHLGAFDLQANQGSQQAGRLSALFAEADLSAFDLILLDCAAISGLLGMNAVMTASDILVPVMADSAAMEGMISMLPVVKRVSRLRHSSVRLWLCLNRLPRGNDFADKLTHMLSAYFPKRLLRTVIFEQDASQTSVYHALALDLLMGRTAK